MRSLVALSALLIACAPATPPAKVRAALSSPPSCIHPEAYGADASDALDDRPALVQAIAAANLGPGCLDLGPGTYRVTRDPVAGATHIASLRITAPIVIAGAGRDATSIMMIGSGIRQGATNPGDWHLFNVQAQGFELRDLTLDGSDRVQTSEQTHLVQLEAARDAVIERVDMRLPSVGPSSGGDCIRLIGQATQWTTRATVRDVRGLVCDRAFVSFQRYVSDALLERIESVSTEVAVDFEPTGSAFTDCSPVINGVMLRDSILRRGAAGTAAYTVQLAGLGYSLSEGITIMSTAIEDGGITTLDVGGLTILGLTLRNTDPLRYPLEIRKRAQRVRVIGSTIEHATGSVQGPAVKIIGLNGFTPTDVSFLGTTIDQRVDGPGISAESLAALTIVGCKMLYGGAPRTEFIVNRGIDAPAGRPVIVDSSVVGSLTRAASQTGIVEAGGPVLIRVTGP